MIALLFLTYCKQEDIEIRTGTDLKAFVVSLSLGTELYLH